MGSQDGKREKGQNSEARLFMSEGCEVKGPVYSLQCSTEMG